MSDGREELARLLASLDEETRARWSEFLHAVDAEVEERGPAAVREHLEAALKHLLAVGWAAHRCYDEEDAKAVTRPVGAAAVTVEAVRGVLAEIAKKPEWSH
jgi:hypothetical protein